jgi:hypothetical protein
VDFGQALHFLRNGKRVARAGWNGQNMFLLLVPGSTFKVNRPPLLGIYQEPFRGPHLEELIDMKTAQGYVVPWLASQSDLLTDDWVEVTDETAKPEPAASSGNEIPAYCDEELQLLAGYDEHWSGTELHGKITPLSGQDMPQPTNLASGGIIDGSTSALLGETPHPSPDMRIGVNCDTRYYTQNGMLVNDSVVSYEEANTAKLAHESGQPLPPGWSFIPAAQDPT